MKTVKVLAGIVLLIAAVSLPVSCLLSRSGGGGFSHTPASGVYSRFGTYTTPSNLSLQIVDDDGLVEFCLKNQSGQELCSNAELHPSVYHKWVFCVDHANRLWMYSGDLGTFVRAPDASGAYVRDEVTRASSAVVPAPRVFIETIPESARRGLSIASDPG